MKKLFIALLLGAAISHAQIPVPAIPLTGNIGPAGIFPQLNSGTLQFTSDANRTMAYPEMSAYVIKVTSTVSLTTTRSLIAPLTIGFSFIIENATTGGQSIQVIGSSGTGVTIPNGTAMLVVSDGTNYVSAGSSGGSGGFPFTLGSTSVAASSSVSSVSGLSVNGVSLTTGGSTSQFLNAAGSYTTPSGASPTGPQSFLPFYNNACGGGTCTLTTTNVAVDTATGNNLTVPNHATAASFLSGTTDGTYQLNHQQAGQNQAFFGTTSATSWAVMRLGTPSQIFQVSVGGASTGNTSNNFFIDDQTNTLQPMIVHGGSGTMERSVTNSALLGNYLAFTNGDSEYRNAYTLNVNGT